MPATIQNYSVAANYTASGFATAFTTAMQDAGKVLHDSFTDGAFVHRIFEETYDNTKTCGKTYLWFVFNGADMFYHICRGWNASTDQPTGTQYLDFLSNATNTTANHMRFALQNAAQTVNIRRYSSNARASFDVILVQNGTTEFHMIFDTTPPIAGLVDLDKECWDGGMMWCRTRAVTNVAGINFQSYPACLRGSFRGRWLRSVTAGTQYGANNTASSPWEIGSGDSQILKGITYGWVGNTANEGNNIVFSGLANGGIHILPIGFNNVNSGGYATDYKPPFYDILLNSYTGAKLPADFSIFGSYVSNTLQTFGGITVGSEDGEIISAFNAVNTPTEKPSAVFYAIKPPPP